MATKEEEAGSTTDPVYKTKIVQFLGRTTPIVLQNENGPCPLLAICNVLLLRNVINLSGDESEVTQQRLLSLVAERLIDSNSNIQGKDESYVNNQQQNIADAIDLLPQLARGLDVNMHFGKINDFEFTRECAIFDLLDIALYHGWIVDPQDAETASAIGSKSYNTLVAELVNKISESSQSKVDFDQDEDSQTVDFAAATTAALGVPCPSLSRGLSFEDNNNKKINKGDLEEERELNYILDISRSQQSDPVTDSSELAKPKVDIFAQNYENGDDKDEGLTFPRLELEGSSSLDMNQFVMDKTGDLQSVVRTGEDNEFVKTGEANEYEKTGGIQLDGKTGEDNEFEKTGGVQSVVKTDEDTELGNTGGVQSVVKTDEDTDLGKTGGVQSDVKTGEANDRTGGAQLIDRTQEDSGFLNGQGVVDEEPIYQGEEHILNNHIYNINVNNNDVNNNDDDNNDKRDLEYESPEPVYEGEVVLAEQFKASDEPQDRQWQLIKHFLESNASQLTIYGLFCLQEGLKERELCVFFRNNHFSTMFKYNGELYLLATDQGYIHQLDLVWEKLNEVNGDTVFMTGNFTPFKAENNRGNESWNQHEAMTNTADYLAALESTDPSVSVTNSDLQLAIALQQQEFDQQQQQQQNRQQQQQQNRQQQQPSPQRAYPVPPPGSGRSRLVVGPPQAQQRPATHPSQRTSEPKLKEKCTIM